MLKTMEWQNNALVLLDQTKLPLAVEYITCHDYRRVCTAISRLEVRGAPAIGVAAAFGMVLGWQELAAKAAGAACGELLPAFRTLGSILCASRPTAVNLEWAVRLLLRTAETLPPATEALAAGEILTQTAVTLYNNDIKTNKLIGNYGVTVVPPGARIMTHCNAGALATCGWGTALGVIRQAAADNKLERVFACETRPLLQGARLTAWELQADGLPVTLITDSMAAWTMKTQGINFIVVGADRIAANGDTANKIGTYALALAAARHRVPFYVAAPISTFDFALRDGGQIPIEERSATEVTILGGRQLAPSGIEVFNPAFDVTPQELLSGIITEKGILSGNLSREIERIRKTLSTEAI